MPADQPAKRRTSPFIVWPVCLFFMVLLYLASLGPVTWLATNGAITVRTYDRMFQTVYFPVDWVRNNSRFLWDHPVGRAYVNYVDWWGA
jgi:hypothetical protein